MGYKNKGRRVGIGGRGRKGKIAPGLLLNDLTGLQFGFLKVHRHIGGDKYECDCNYCLRPFSKVLRGADLRRGKYKSCGCLRRERLERAAADREARAYANPTGKRGHSYGWGSTVAGMIANR